MRLICPNCDAQYEVDASLIPETGRDVQCSDCGHVWFQAPDMETDADTTMDDDIAALVRPGGADGAEMVPGMAPVADPSPPAPAPEADPEPDPQVLRRHTLDESLMAVLREEAERETRARAEDAARAAGRGLEMQTELGLADADPAPRLRIRPRDTARQPAPQDTPQDDSDPEPASMPAAASGASARPARRELLPDIDRINSTLDASNANRSGGAAVRVPASAERQRGGFRAGFLLVLVLGALGWGAYAESDRLAAALPQAGPVIDGYVALVDMARSGLDSLVRGLLESLNRQDA
jgi:predicted Zn finger-like uncharacterized protein